MENTGRQDGLLTEHGLSLYLETGNHKILFDAGQTGAFAENAKAMGVNLSEVDLAVLSHGHYDHSGGMERFLEENAKAPVYLSCHAFEPYYSGLIKYIGLKIYIGLNKSLRKCDRMILTGNKTSYPADDVVVLDQGLELHSCNAKEKRFEMNRYGLYRVEGGKKVPDDFRHEQYLLIREGEKKILISGCSHKGILNIVDWFRPDVLIGGFHFMKLDPDGKDRAVLEEAARVLKSYPTIYYTGHCTGQAQYEFLKERMGGQLHYLATGDTLIL